jgi:hypothetical protein
MRTSALEFADHPMNAVLRIYLHALLNTSKKHSLLRSESPYIPRPEGRGFTAILGDRPFFLSPRKTIQELRLHSLGREWPGACILSKPTVPLNPERAGSAARALRLEFRVGAGGEMHVDLPFFPCSFAAMGGSLRTADSGSLREHGAPRSGTVCENTDLPELAAHVLAGAASFDIFMERDDRGTTIEAYL